MSGVKRYTAYDALMHVEDSGKYVFASDYAALEDECARLSGELDKTELRALKFIHQCSAHVELYQELKAERDQLRAQVEAMRAAVSGYLLACYEGEHEYQVKIARHNMRQILAVLQAKP